MTTSNGYGKMAREENGEFCVTGAPVTRTDGILTQLLEALAARSWLSDNMGHMLA